MGGGCAPRASRSAWSVIWKKFVTRRTKRFSAACGAGQVRGADRGPAVRWTRKPGNQACGRCSEKGLGFAGAVGSFSAIGGDALFPLGFSGFVGGGVIAEGTAEFLHLLLRRLSGDAVTLLDDAHELIALAADHVEVIVG